MPRRSIRRASRPSTCFRHGAPMLKPALCLCVVAAMLSGCSVATNIQHNTEAIDRSSASINTNTAAVQESTTGTTSLVPALQGAERLREPLQQVANLEPTLKSVASLGDPLGRVAGLEGSLRG